MVDPVTDDDGWDTGDETGYTDPARYDPTDTSEYESDSGWTDAGAELEDDEPDEERADAAIEPQFANVVEWVEGFFLPVIRRRITDQAGSGLSWDERWWLYPEVIARLTALHYAWEEARASDKASAMSAWWVHHLEPHVRVIFDSETGPMANADKDGSFSGWPALPGQPVPAALLDEILGVEQ